MKTRIIYTRFWHDNYISELNSKEKLIFIYLITNEKVNICGIYELPDKYIRFDLDLKQTELENIKQKFMKDNKFIFINGWVKIINYDIYNKFTGDKNETAKEKELALIPKNIIEYRWGIDSVSINGDTLNNHNHNQYINKKEGDIKGEKEKKKHNDAVFLTDIEHKKLVKELGEPLTKEYIERLSLYIRSQGLEKKYKSHYATILTWNRNDIKQNRAKKTKLTMEEALAQMKVEE